MAKLHIPSRPISRIHLALRSILSLTLLPTIILTSISIHHMVHAGTFPPTTYISLLGISCLSLLYTSTTTILHLLGTLPLLVTAISDSALSILYLSVAITLGHPLLSLSCPKVGALSHLYHPLSDETLYPSNPRNRVTARSAEEGSTGYQSGTIAFKFEADGTVTQVRGVDYGWFVGGSEGVCRLMKGAWGVGLVVLVLFAASAGVGAWRWVKERREKRGEKIGEIA